MKIKLILLPSPVVSNFLYACQSWTLDEDLEKRIVAFETIAIEDCCKCIKSCVHPTWRYPAREVQNGSLANTVLQGKVDGKRSRGRPARQWLDNGMDKVELECDVGRAREPCGLEKACQSCCHQRIELSRRRCR